MSGIILDARLLLAMEALEKLGEFAGRDKAFTDGLWQELMELPELMKEFMYYVDNHSFADKFNVQGYSMTDLYVFQMSRYKLIHDVGKSESGVNHEFMVLGAFHDMYCMTKEPEEYIKRLSEGPGMDRMY